MHSLFIHGVNFHGFIHRNAACYHTLQPDIIIGENEETSQ